MKTIALYQAFRHNGLEYPQNVEHGIIEAQSREGRGIGFGQSGLERRKLVGHLECLYPRAGEDRLDSIGYGSNLSNRYCRPVATNRRARRSKTLFSSPGCPGDSSFFRNVTGFHGFHERHGFRSLRATDR